MKKEFTITLKAGSLRGDFYPKKWEIIKINSNGSEGIVISEPYYGISNTIKQYSIYPYKRKKTKFGKWLWFKWLKLRIWLGIIKTH